jgi:hypothetical protein
MVITQIIAEDKTISQVQTENKRRFLYKEKHKFNNGKAAVK